MCHKVLSFSVCVCMCVCESLRHCCWSQYPSLNLTSALQCFHTVVEQEALWKFNLTHMSSRVASVDFILENVRQVL